MKTRGSRTVAVGTSGQASAAARFQLAPAAHAVALMLAAGSVSTMAHAQQAFSSAWFASKGATQNSAAATGYLPNGTPAALLTNPAQQQQQANAQLQRSINNLSALARGIAAQQAAQEAARQAALANGGSVPDGLADGGLKVDTNSLTRGWINANAPTQSTANGKTTVAIQQTADKAILNWESFNVGKNTILSFAQDANWAVLNRINDPAARPSQIQGQISAPGTVMIANRNGIVFAGSSQIDVRNLVAAAARITDAQFRDRGLYYDSTGTAPSFTDAAGKVLVEAGAQIATSAPASVTQGGGYVLLMGNEVRNAGQINTPGGQAALAAGDTFTIRKGVGTDTNAGSTTAGNEISAQRLAAGTTGVAINSGLITAANGDVTLTGHAVTQAGVAIASTSIAKRGTVHLSARAGDGTSSVTLAPGAITAVVLDASDATGLDGQRDPAIQRMGQTPDNLVAGVFDNLSTVSDRKDLSRIEIVSGNTVEFQGGSMTLATGGEIVASAPRRTLVDNGATLDVSGAVGVKVAMESNNVAINIQGNEQRDASVNRDAKNLNNLNLWVDRRRLVLVPAGTNGYEADRWYTEGGLLEVSGYLATSGHTVGEWMAQGGAVTVTGGDLVTRAGSVVNLSGGTLDVASGRIRQSWLKGADGGLYEVNSAPGDLLYTGQYRGFEVAHARWGDKTTEYYYNPLIAPQSRLENGYTAGRDAGRLVVATSNAVLEGTIAADTYQGPRQVKAALPDTDGYYQTHTAVARRGALILGQYRPIYDAASKTLRYALAPTLDQVTLAQAVAAMADGMALEADVDVARKGRLVLDAGVVNATGLGALRIAAGKTIAANGAVQVADGGEIVFYAPSVDVNGNLVAHGGSIALGNIRKQMLDTGTVGDAGQAVGAGIAGGVRLHEGTVLDASGRFADLRQGDDVQAAQNAQAFVDGGTVSIRTTDDLTLASGSLIDVSSGAVVQANGSIAGGRGGSVQLGSGLMYGGATKGSALLIANGEIRGYGVKGGGTLDLESANAIAIGGQGMTAGAVLKAGESMPFDLVLLKAYEVNFAAGSILPIDYRYVITQALPGDMVGRTGIRPGTVLVPAANWVPPTPLASGRYGISVNGSSATVTKNGIEYNLGLGQPPRIETFIPAGARVTFSISQDMTNAFERYVVPAAIFPGGIPVADRAARIAAGTAAPFNVTMRLEAGAHLAAGGRLPIDVAVAPTSALPVDFFQAGFSQYKVRAQNGLVVPDGVVVDVTMPVLRADLSSLPASADLKQAFSPLLPDLYLDQAAKRSVTQRQGASIALAAGVADIGVGGSLFVGEGAAIRVDPGQSISLSARADLAVHGLLQAKGGNISVLGPQTPTPGTALEAGGLLADGESGNRTVLLGEHAVLDATAAAYTATDALGRPYGVLGNGGNIVIGGTLLESKARSIGSDAFVVIREGALVDASGGSAWLDVDGRGARQVSSSGGSIQLASSRGIYLDGLVRAAAGGAGAYGGTLSMALEAPNYVSTTMEAAVNVLRELTLVQQRQPGASDRAGLNYGHALLGADQVRDGGFSSLALYSNGVISFGADLDLSLNRELRLYSGALTLTADARPGINVSLAAPYVVLGGIADNGATSDLYTRPFFQGGVTTLASTAVLNVHGELVDLKDAITLGIKSASRTFTVERPGFARFNLVSEGDIRFVKGAGMVNGQKASAELLSHGDIVLRAAQIYPATGASGLVRAGMVGDSAYDPAGRLIVERYDAQAADPAVPHAVFGSLTLSAASIEQGGVLRAPLGKIILGTDATASVVLAPGSLTSVSAADLVMPYGGTTDGVNYLYRGGVVKFNGVSNAGSIALNATAIDVQGGAQLDLAGGGELLGAGFVSGRGGSSDARMSPLIQVGPKGFTLPSLASNPVYAIWPAYGAAYAPVDGNGAADPRIGQQVTIGSNQVPGLAAGTYTLLPSNYALMPGAFRVEINGASTPAAGAVAMRNGSFAVAGSFGTVNTGLADSLPRALVVTPAAVLRSYSQYNETGYADFAIQQAALVGTVRPLLPADAKDLSMTLGSSPASSLHFAGRADFTPGQGGQGGIASLSFGQSQYLTGQIEILGDGALRTAGFGGLSVHASDLNAIGANRLIIGGEMTSTYGVQPSGTNASNFIDISANARSLVLRQGAVLRAPDVVLVTNNPAGGITIEAGAGINTIGMGRSSFDSSQGYLYRPAALSLVAASNGWMNILPPQADKDSTGGGVISIGACPGSGACQGATELYSEGSLVIATRRDFLLTDRVRYGTRNLVLSMGAVNIGSAEALDAAAARGALSTGWRLNQSVLDRLLRGDTAYGAPALERLLRGDTAYGAPALERLVLSAAESVNLFGSVSLSTLNPATGKSSLANLVLSTPAIYGYGAATDVASISTGKLTWAGLAGGAPAPVVGGRGTGAGRLAIDADVIEFGYDATAQPNGLDDFSRTILGFADVRLAARERITANHKGALLVYQAQTPGADGLQYTGGNLQLVTPLMTGNGGSVNSITAGGALSIVAPASGPASAAAATLAAGVETGAELKLSAGSVAIDTTVALPSGKLSVNAQGDVSLGSASRLDLSGRELNMLDVKRYSWGGDLILQSQAGNVLQAAGSVIDLSAVNNNAGTLGVYALADGAGRVDLQGSLRGSGSGYYDAGGTLVPYRAGSLDVRAQALGNGSLNDGFAALNNRLNEGGLSGERSFQLKRGDLVIGNELRAHQVNVSVDGGSLLVNGVIDASGEQVGSIRLAAANGLALAAGAVLDAHGTVLRVDSYGKIIDSPNRASVQLDAGRGLLALGGGARIDLRHGTNAANGDGANRGTLDLIAARVGSSGNASDADAATFGDIAIDARGAIDIQGARSIAVYGRQRYTDAAYGSDPAASGRPYQVIDQAYLDAKHAQSEQFMNAALANGNLLNNKLAGLNIPAYRQALHLRPAIEIASATPQGDLVVQGDLDLSGMRYASLNPLTHRTATYGSGEVGMLNLRAGGDLSVYGSINDGFAPPPDTPDDGGWVLVKGVQPYGGDVVVPRAGVTLADGTTYPAGRSLNYAITAKNVTLPAGTVLPATVSLDRALTLPAGTVLAADVRAANGSVLLAAGTPVGSGGLALPIGAQLLAGIRLPVALVRASLSWPKGVPLPVDMVQLGSLALPVGALIAAGTNVVLPGDAKTANLRPAASDGRQARNWAVAQMLPEGSQSWSMRLVAGADLGAADTRARNTARTGNLVLADTHYSVQKTGGGQTIGLNEGGVQAVVSAAGALPGGISSPQQLVGKTKDEIVALYGAFSWDDFSLGADFWDPARGNVQLALSLQGANAVMNAAGALPDGYTSVTQLVGKTEKELIALYGAFAWSDFSMPPNFWQLGQGNGTVISDPLVMVPKSPNFSVLRTGTGDLDLAAGGNLSMPSAFGVYTAGAQRGLGSTALDALYNQARGQVNGATVLGNVAGASAPDYEKLVAGATRLYQAWYPDGGGNLRVDVGGDLTGTTWSSSYELAWSNSSVGNWLWRQGTGDTAGVNGIPSAWWINFGTYAYKNSQDNAGQPLYWPMVVGFTGIGTLGGGDASIRVGGDAGMIDKRGVWINPTQKSAQSEGIVLAVGGTGRVLADGSLALTGGGDLDVRIGGGWNSHPEARLHESSTNGMPQAHELYGGLVNLRGAIAMRAGQIGVEELFYATQSGKGQDVRELRAADPYVSSLSTGSSGLMLMAGDSGMNVASRGDLVLGGTGNAGLVGTPNGVAFGGSAGAAARGVTWFNLWTDRTALHLASAGGNLVLDTRASEDNLLINQDASFVWDYNSSGGWFLLPGEVSAVAPSGSIYYGSSAAYLHTVRSSNQWNKPGLLVAPLGKRNIELLAGDSIYGGGYVIAVSGANPSVMASTAHPGFAGYGSNGSILAGSYGIDAGEVGVAMLPLMIHGANTVGSVAGIVAEQTEPSRFYAVQGDIIGLQSGAKVGLNGQRHDQTDYVGAGPVAIKAGRDIVYSGNRLGDAVVLYNGLSNGVADTARVLGNLIVNTHANDVSVIQAGRDILYFSAEVAGPGTLEISAGRNILQNERASIVSIGPVVREDHRPGAGIVVQAGLGSGQPNYSGLLAQYIDASNLAVAGMPLADQPGKVAKSYGPELAAWLAGRYGVAGTAEDNLAYFNALAPEQQRIFARQIYFNELREGGREYNAAGSARYGSYLRGRRAIAAMFGDGNYDGDLVIYGGAGIHTDLGGDIQVLTPGGGQTYGVEGAAPPSTAGLITRGQGDISMYARDSLLLGQSRVMTTFGGSIMAWSAQGDINAGRGAKTTVVYTPPRRVYDNVGDVTLSPQVPSTGAGIATLAPIAEVPPGDVDLIAPLGTIDAGEAGIRVSGNINVAALQIVNAANIQVQGKSAGLPVIAAVNIGALTNASAAASSAAMAAQDAVSRERAAARQNLPSVFTVRVLGFGPAAGDGQGSADRLPQQGQQSQTRRYETSSPVQLVGNGQSFDPSGWSRLSPEERRRLANDH